MLLYKLKEMECALEKSTSKDKGQLESVTNLKNLLLKIDYKAEIVPENSVEKLEAILTELKGKSLSFNEKKLLKEIV